MEMQTKRFLEMSFVEEWHFITLYGAYLFFVLSGVITIVYFIGLLLIGQKSKKYDYINKYEAQAFYYSLLSIVIAIGLLINSAVELLFTSGNLFEFLMGIFMAGIISAVIGYAAYAYFKYYYPGVVENKLNKIRFSPRISPETGKPMRLLSEKEEDAYLTPKMIAEEESFAYEYDVWIDEESGHKFIEKYDAHLHAILCPNCNFRTSREQKEVILKLPQDHEPGTLQKHYKCTYCGHKDIKETSIAPLFESGKVLS